MSAQLEQVAAVPAMRHFAQLGRAARGYRAREDRGLRGGGGERAERFDVRRRSGRCEHGGPVLGGAATTSSIGTPSTVTPTARRSLCSSRATTCGDSAKRANLGRDRRPRRRPRGCSHVSRQRRTSPAGSPSTPSAIAPTSSRARLSSNPGRGAARSRARARRAGAPRSSARCRAPRADAPRTPRPATRPPCARRARARSPPSASHRVRGSGRSRSRPERDRARAPPAPRSARSPPAPAGGPRCRVRCRATPAPGRARPAPRLAAAPPGSCPPPAGTPVRCTGSRRSGRAARRMPPAGPRSSGSPSRQSARQDPNAADFQIGTTLRGRPAEDLERRIWPQSRRQFPALVPRDQPPRFT